MKIFMLTGLYAAFLGSVMLWHGCSTEPDSSRSTQFEDASASERRQDPPADPPGTPSPVSQVPTDPKDDWPEPIRKIRDEVSKEHCENEKSTIGRDIKPALVNLKCRVEEQQRWLKNSLLYKAPNSNHTCVTQTNENYTKVLSFSGKDATMSGMKWVKQACKAAVDKALEELSAREDYEIDRSLPDKDDVASQLENLVSNEHVAFSDTHKPSHDIEQMLRYSIYRINHNCSDLMDTGNFLERKIHHDLVEKNVEPKYIFREYYTYESDTINPAIARVWHIIAEEKTVKQYPGPYQANSSMDYDTNNNNIFDLTEFASIKGNNDLFYPHRLLYEEARSIIPVRKIKTTCDAISYKRHEDHSSGSRPTYFFENNRFNVRSNYKGLTCKDVANSRQKLVIPAKPLPPLVVEVPPLETKSFFDLAQGCKLVGTTNDSIECYTRKPPTGSTLEDYCNSLSNPSFFSYIRGYCEFGSAPKARYHAVFGGEENKHGYYQFPNPHGAYDTDDGSKGCHIVAPHPMPPATVSAGGINVPTGAFGEALTKLQEEITKKDACVLTLGLEPKNDTSKELGLFFGISSDELGECQREIAPGLEARDYKQLDLCARPYDDFYTYYADYDETERDLTLVREGEVGFAAFDAFRSDFTKARKKFCKSPS